MLNRVVVSAGLGLCALAACLEPAAGDLFGAGVGAARAAAPDVRTPQPDRSTDARVEIRYVANSGMLVVVSGRRFLIDAPIRDGLPPYATSPPAERGPLEGARAPYDAIDAILITHWHEDHFDPEAVAAHLSNSPRTVLISSPEVVDRVRRVAPRVPASQLRAVLPPPGRHEAASVGGVSVRVLRIRHNPARRLPEQHVGFLIGDTSPVLHVGDADPVADNFALLRDLPPVDLALLPYWYVASERSRRVVTESIGPRRVVAMHVPPGEASQVPATLRDANVRVEVAAHPGTWLAVER